MAFQPGEAVVLIVRRSEIDPQKCFLAVRSSRTSSFNDVTRDFDFGTLQDVICRFDERSDLESAFNEAVAAMSLKIGTAKVYPPDNNKCMPNFIKLLATLTCLIALPTAEFQAVADQQHMHQEQAETEPVQESAPLSQTITASTGSEFVVVVDAKGAQIRAKGSS